MEKISGTWRLVQKWGNSPAYFFLAEFKPNGTVTVPARNGVGPFFGTYTITPQNQIAMAIASFNKPQSVSAYIGHFSPYYMGGSVEGANVNGVGIAGTWQALHMGMAEAAEQDFHVPAE